MKHDDVIRMWIIHNAALAYAGTLEIHARTIRKGHRGPYSVATALEQQAKEIREAVNDDEHANSPTMAAGTRA